MSPHPRRSACTALRGAPRLPHNLATKGLALGMGILRARLLGPLPCPAPARASLLFLRNTKNKRTQDTCIRKSCCGNSLPPTPLGLCAASPYWGGPHHPVSKSSTSNPQHSLLLHPILSLPSFSSSDSYYLWIKYPCRILLPTRRAHAGHALFSVTPVPGTAPGTGKAHWVLS